MAKTSKGANLAGHDGVSLSRNSKESGGEFYYRVEAGQRQLDYWNCNHAGCIRLIFKVKLKWSVINPGNISRIKNP
jgi:hypothetical protein